MTAPEFTCNRCGRQVPPRGARYRATLEIVHLAETLEITEEELRQDHGAEIRRLLAAMARRDPVELEEEVYLKRTIRLCARCRRDLLTLLEPGRTRPKRHRRRPPRPRRPGRR